MAKKDPFLDPPFFRGSANSRVLRRLELTGVTRGVTTGVCVGAGAGPAPRRAPKQGGSVLCRVEDQKGGVAWATHPFSSSPCGVRPHWPYGRAGKGWLTASPWSEWHERPSSLEAAKRASRQETRGDTHCPDKYKPYNNTTRKSRSTH